MDITLNAIAFRGGVPYSTELNLTQRPNGTWHTTNFDDILKRTHDADKAGASQSHSCDTCGEQPAAQTRLSDQEIVRLAKRYNPRSMTQEQYDAFLDDLIETGALSRFDAMRLGHHGWRILDIDLGAFASGGGGIGSAYASGSADERIQSLEDADGDLIRWLEVMLAWPEQGAENTETLKLLSDIVRRMQKV